MEYINYPAHCQSIYKVFRTVQDKIGLNMKNSSWKSDSKRFVILRLFQKESLHYIYHTKYTGRSRSELDPASDATVAPLNEVLNFQLALRLQQAVVVNQAAPSS